VCVGGGIGPIWCSVVSWRGVRGVLRRMSLRSGGGEGGLDVVNLIA
jgi:hypothetical protein